MCKNRLLSCTYVGACEGHSLWGLHYSHCTSYVVWMHGHLQWTSRTAQVIEYMTCQGCMLWRARQARVNGSWTTALLQQGAAPPCTFCNRKRPGILGRQAKTQYWARSSGPWAPSWLVAMPALQGPTFPMPVCLRQVFTALQGLIDPQKSLQSRRANLVLCSQSGRAFCVCSADTRKELRSPCSDTSQRSTHSGLKWLSWPKGTPPWDANDEMVRGFFYGAGDVSFKGAVLPGLFRQMVVCALPRQTMYFPLLRLVSLYGMSLLALQNLQ